MCGERETECMRKGKRVRVMEGRQTSKKGVFPSLKWPARHPDFLPSNRRSPYKPAPEERNIF
jgi:hypothetical protein